MKQQPRICWARNCVAKEIVVAAGNKSDVDMKVWFNEKLGISAGQQTMTSFMASNNTAPV